MPHKTGRIAHLMRREPGQCASTLLEPLAVALDDDDFDVVHRLLGPNYAYEVGTEWYMGRHEGNREVSVGRSAQKARLPPHLGSSIVGYLGAQRPWPGAGPALAPRRVAMRIRRTVRLLGAVSGMGFVAGGLWVATPMKACGSDPDDRTAGGRSDVRQHGHPSSTLARRGPSSSCGLRGGPPGSAFAGWRV